MMRLGLVVLVSSTVVIGYGNYLAKEKPSSAPAGDELPGAAREAP